MRGYLIDTQTVEYLFNETSPQHQAVKHAYDSCPGGVPLEISAITRGEIEYGLAIHPEGDGQRRAEFLKFLKDRFPKVLEISHHTAEPYGKIRAALANRYPPKGGWKKKKRAEQMSDPRTGRELGIDENDLWLAAQALERNYILVTNDKMTRIKDAIKELVPAYEPVNWAADALSTKD